MKVGFVGCGKLGLMVALTIESCGHEVKGYDVSENPAKYLRERSIPFQEEHAQELLAETRMEMVTLEDLCRWADLLFLAPQTPHQPQFEGAAPLPEERADFDYTHLKACVHAVDTALVRPTPVVIISTVLPGTLEREILPLLGPYFDLVYSPQFIAMGTVHQDFMHPEFWLLGCRSRYAARYLTEFYETISLAPVIATDIRTAEGIKVFYNTFITAKTVLANLYGEMACRLNMNVDDIYRAITCSTRRLLSPKYLKAGMGDGGGCHPRDNIALSWLAEKIGMGYNFFDDLMRAREKHCEFLADLIEEHRGHRRIIILGRAFKPETNIEAGSPSLLLSAILDQRGVPHTITEQIRDVLLSTQNLFFIGTQHERYAKVKFPKGSVVIDPFRYIPDQDGVEVVRIGEPRTLKAATVSA